MKIGTSKSFYTNTSALLMLQIANYILPFLLIPYLTRTLGAPLYGIIAFGFAMVQLACIITDYGFSLSATYTISIERDNKEYVNKIIGAVITCKTVLLILVSLMLAGYLFFETKYADHKIFLWLMMISIVGQTYQPTWFFQGIEKMVYITIYTVLSRIVYLLLVIWLVTSPSNYYWVAIGNGIGYLVSAGIGMAMMQQLGYRFKWPGWTFLKKTFTDSTEFFWSRAAVATYTSCGTFYLGLFSTPLQVAYYSAAEQLYRGGQSLFYPISQALFPHMAKHKNFSLFFKVMKYTILASILGIAGGIFFGPWVLDFLFGSPFINSYPILILFLIIFAITTPSILLGYPFLGALGLSKLANRSVLFAGAIQLILLTFCYLFNWTSGIAVSITVLLVESIVLSLRAVWATKAYRNIKHQQL